MPRKPWHFIKDHGESMKCIRLILKKQRESRNKDVEIKNRKSRGKKKSVFVAKNYAGGFFDMANDG